MIKIQEIKPIKLSGLSSLFITFDFNNEIIDILKGFQPAVFHKKLVGWEISSIYLSRVLDALTRLDDIELKLLDDGIEQVSCADLSENEIVSFKYKPFDHQIEGINFLLKQKKSLLLDGCGVGKSLQIMYTAETLHKRQEISHCLIICGVDSLRSNWKSEIGKFSKETCVVLGEKITKTGKTVYDTVAKRAEQLLNPISEFFVVMNVATLRDDRIVDAIMKGPNKFGMIVVDEIHRLATKSSAQGNNLLKLKSDYKIGASGTLIVNNAVSAYVPLSWTENDNATLTNYKAQYCNFGGFNNSQVIGYKNLDLLKEELDHCSIRRTFSMIKGDMPKLTIEYETVEMSDEHAKFYDAIKNGVKEEADKINLNSSNLLALMTRLRQATSAPSVLTTQDIMSSKVERAIDIVEELLDSGEKAIVFCNFIETAERTARLLTKYNPILCTGNQSEDSIRNGIENFRNTDKANLIVATMAKLGTGFSFPECHYAIFIDQPFTYALFEQAYNRVYRVTSDQPVFIKVLTCKDTVDERVQYIIENKKDLADYLVDGVENPSFTNELRDIITSL